MVGLKMKRFHSMCLSTIVRPRTLVESSMMTGGRECLAESRISKAMAGQGSRPCKPHRPQWVGASRKSPSLSLLWSSRNDRLQFPHLGYMNAPQRWPTREARSDRSPRHRYLFLSLSVETERLVTTQKCFLSRSYFLLLSYLSCISCICIEQHRLARSTNRGPL
jgi:hypothetical protein